ncbi:MAG: bifunctional nicotinamidase/pyrazinamidase [Methanothrix sp.]|nr:bifunctional nicotinamidase/pyrazinamidase [Methanothrix sp.]
MNSLRLSKALLVVDVQNDFCPGGALGISGGERIIPFLNRYIKYFERENLPIFVTRDWHPKVTKHFEQFGGVWPEHCVEESYGAQFHPELEFPKEALVMSKGMDPEEDSYSAFQSTDSSGMALANLLKNLGVSQIYIGGLATDYCVKYSVLDALRGGLEVFILIDAIAGVNLQPEDSNAALEEMVGCGAKKTFLRRIFSEMIAR